MNIKKKAAFLDRDGVINIDYGYVHQWNNFVFCDRAIEGLKILYELGYLLIIITNQSGIARGIFTEDQYNHLTKKYVLELRKAGVEITSILHCPHHPSFSEPPFDNCNCRKPMPGLFEKAIEINNISPENSIALGDNERDLIAAKKAGIIERYFITNKKNLNLEYPKLSVHKTLYDCSIYIRNNS